MLCKAFGLGEKFDMHSLKQVYFYVECVDLYCLNQVLKVVLNWISENPDFQQLVLPQKNLIQNQSTFWG